MKKLIALLLALVMVFSVAAVFAGCEDDSKKSSKSEEKDDEEEEKDDETTEPDGKGDETTEPEEKPTEADPTEPDPTDAPTDPEPTEPDPTEEVSGELQAAPDEVFDENTKELMLICNITSDGNVVPVFLGIQQLSDSEVLIAIEDDSSDCVIRVCNDGTITRYEFDSASETYIEDPNADMSLTTSEIQGAMAIIGMFTSPATAFGEDAQYKKLGVSEIEGYGDVACYEVYIEGALTYYAYIHVESAVILCIADSEGNDLHYVDDVSFEAPISDYLA